MYHIITNASVPPRLSAKADGVVKLHVAEGDICSEGKVLCEIVGDAE